MTSDAGSTSPVGDAAHRARRLHRLVTCTLLLGAALGAVVLLLPQTPLMATDVPLPLAVAVLVALAALSEVAYVRVRTVRAPRT
jgi:hypothetical protein